jgi:protein-tyrosine-phosphatase
LKLTMLFYVIFFMASFGAARGAANEAPAADAKQTVVFVCEHGAAKSIVAAAYFNKLAAENFRAIARGTSPQAEISASAAKGLQADGLTPGERKPKELTKDDVFGAARVVTFWALPKELNKADVVEEWNDVPAVGDDYKKARDTILAHMQHLLETLKGKHD